MPLDEQIMKKTEIQKITPIPRREQKRSKITGEDTGRHGVRKQQSKDGNINYRKNGYNIIIGYGLDEKIQIDNRKNTANRTQSVGKRKSNKKIPGPIRKQPKKRYRNKYTIETRTLPGKTKSETDSTTPTRRGGTRT